MRLVDSRILVYIHDFVETNGYSPTVREIKDDLELGSLDLVHKRLIALRGAGIVNWRENQSRTLHVVNHDVVANEIKVLSKSGEVRRMGSELSKASLDG